VLACGVLFKKDIVLVILLLIHRSMKLCKVLRKPSLN